MNWTQDTPSQEGTYWFRRTKHKSPKQVTIKGDKVAFKSGNTKNLAHVKGQWLGPIVPSNQKQEKQPGFFKSIYNRLPGPIVSTVGKIVLAILIPVLLGTLLISEPKLVYVGEWPEYPMTPQIVQT